MVGAAGRSDVALPNFLNRSVIFLGEPSAGTPGGELQP